MEYLDNINNINNIDNIKKELNDLENQGLILNYSIKSNEIVILSNERMTFFIETDFYSYYKLVSIINEKEKVYYNEYFESFEGLLSTYSIKYCEKFNNLLFDKLNSLKSNEEEEEEKEENSI